MTDVLNDKQKKRSRRVPAGRLARRMKSPPWCFTWRLGAAYVPARPST
jgi:hypothetical protein